MQLYYWWWPLASQDTNTATNGVTWPKHNVVHDFDCLPMLVPLASHDQISHVASYFDCVNLMNAKKPVVPLTMLSASCDANVSTKCITWQKKLFCSSFWLSWSTNAVVLWWCHVHQMILKLVAVASHKQKSLVASHFNHLTYQMEWHHW